MKGTIGLEHIGANVRSAMASLAQFERSAGIHASDELPYSGPAVAEIYRDGDLVCRRFLDGKRDYSKANSKGSRGIFVWYTLEQDRLYWVRAPQSWHSVETYFAALRLDGSVYRLSEQEAAAWVSAL